MKRFLFLLPFLTAACVYSAQAQAPGYSLSAGGGASTGTSTAVQKGDGAGGLSPTAITETAAGTLTSSTQFTLASGGTNQQITLSPTGRVQISGQVAGGNSDLLFQVTSTLYSRSMSFDNVGNFYLSAGRYFSPGGYMFASATNTGVSFNSILFGVSATAASDAGVSRGAAGQINIGNGTSGDATGILSAGTVLEGGLTHPRILSTTSVNAFTVANTALFTVPTGKTCVVTGYAVRVTAASGVTTGPTAGVGNAAGTNNIAASQAMNGLTSTATTGSTSLFSWPIVGMSSVTPAAGVIYFNLGTTATGTSETIAVDLIGYLY